jgi:hypothetical protein
MSELHMAFLVASGQSRPFKQRTASNMVSGSETDMRKCNLGRIAPPVCTENLIRVDEVAESPKLAQ